MTTEEQNQQPAPAKLSQVERNIIEAQVVEAIRTCYDPEIPVNIHELGLIYSVNVAEDGAVEVAMTLTTPYCPAAQSLPPEVDAKVRSVPGVTSSSVRVVWEPPWSPAMMSEAARLELGIF
jgi:FeS assembly SUF system protein